MGILTKMKGKTKMSRYRVNFYDNDSNETRGLVVQATSEDDAEDKAQKRADRDDWPSSFRIGDAEELD